ncbi:hypothetical protein SARC_03655 [Sphaeroforma arctica JP610]|uniref:Uncharacterized protein n=1 Tax=Sphaeroforma arctica JP610 TaxID=667725 RepID=A0A0L0G5M7_9EUKA|nr:hypothetical protein SARC_03655 [Sphaeroforma arctica JP610]KNC84111.1 hypothetical protein SARC_03655 [Sphaeroforma arctica JP610]|eukprot:XP_014158013.1 hypothetical protein SARC_03655 [Sphaeroforma arctica JP610]
MVKELQSAHYQYKKKSQTSYSIRPDLWTVQFYPPKMKLIVALAALCGAVSAMSPPQPSWTPAPEREPISCVEKDQLNNICGKNKRPIVSDFECCQWSGQCGYGIPKCLERNCCEDKRTPAPKPPAQTDTPSKPTDTHPEPTASTPKPTPIPTPLPVVPCGITVGAEYFDDYVCDAKKHSIVNFPKECCAEKDGACGDIPFCSEKQCCMPEKDLPELVMTCPMKLEIEKKENHRIAYTCDDDFHVRDDGYLCCRWSTSVTEKKKPECYEFGVFQKCRESSCCVPNEEFEDDY